MNLNYLIRLSFWGIIAAAYFCLTTAVQAQVLKQEESTLTGKISINDIPFQKDKATDLIAQGITEVTGVELNQTDKGLQVILETARGQLVPLIIPEGNNLVTVIDRQEIEEQTNLTRDLGDILGREVPGLAPGNQSLSEFGQTLRGRNQLVLIDGVPQSSSRNAFRNLRTIDPSVIERIEIVRGPTALYGDGATGGIINIITQTGEGKPSFPVEVGFGGSLSNIDTDSFTGIVQAGFRQSRIISIIVLMSLTIALGHSLTQKAIAFPPIYKVPKVV